MKKIILVLAFVFAGTYLANAGALNNVNKENATNVEEYFGCWEVADMVVRVSQAFADCNGHSFTYEQAHEVWLAAWDTCNAQ